MVKNRKSNISLGALQRQKYQEVTNKEKGCTTRLNPKNIYSNARRNGQKPSISSILTMVLIFFACIYFFNISSDDDTAAANTAASSTSSTAAAAAKPAEPTPPAPAVVALSSDGYPVQCTPEQSRKVSAVMTGCSEQPWLQACAFTKLTRGCQSPQLMREFYTTNKDFHSTTTNFIGVIVGWRQKDETPLDTLYVGSSPQEMDYTKFESLKNLWNSRVPRSGCQIPALKKDVDVGTSNIAKTQILVVDEDPDRYNLLQQVKSVMSLGDDKFVVDNTNVGGSPPSTLTKIMQTKLGLQDNQPIHYMDLIWSVASYNIIMRQIDAPVLKNIRYLTFDYNWQGDWGDGSAQLLPAIKKLRDNGLVCYWAGSSDTQYKFWRITDCWLDQYYNKQWSRIACVNVLHDDVKGLASQMEKKFLETIG
jgi:hypothetical protein